MRAVQTGSTHLRFPFLAGLILAAACAGCTPSGGDPGAQAASDCSAHLACQPGDLLSGCGQCVHATATLDIAACTKGLSTSQIEGALALSVGFVDAAALLDDAGRLEDRLATDLRQVFIFLAFNPDLDQLRAPFHRGDGGIYAAPLAYAKGSRVEERFLFGVDYQAGKAGEIILPSVFRADSYLVGAKVGGDLWSGSAKISYDEPGPLVELLGLGAHPDQPFTMSYIESEQELKKQLLDSTVIVDETARGGGVVRFQAHTRRAVLAGEDLNDDVHEVDPITLSSSGAESEIANDTLGQTGEVTAWDLTVFASSRWDVPPVTTGTIELRVHGGPFAHRVKLTFDPAQPRPSAVWTCDE